MKKVIVLIVVLLSCIIDSSFAQLYVSNNYVYVADKYLYVQQDVNIQSSGNLYLRNESQLLQAKTGNSVNSGAGKLSVFQEGTVNNFAYNYWCSPVGNSVTASGNESFGITMLNRPTSAIASTPATILPITSNNGISDPLSISQGWIFKFLSSSLYSDWFGVYAASTLNPGEGFTMKGTAGIDAAFTDAGVTNNPGSKQRYDFRGRPNDGDITINLAAGKLTLTGNPYPSAIDLRAFLIGATNSTGIAYFWEQDKTVNSHLIAAYKGGYGTYAANVGPMGTYVPAVFYAYDGAGTQLLQTGGLGGNYERRFCPIGQGFMLEGGATGTVTMKNSYRVYQKEGAGNFSQFERNGYVTDKLTSDEDTFLPEIPSVSGFDYTTVSTKPAPQIRINALMNNQAVRQSALVFQNGATDGVDFAADAKSPDTTADMDMYFVINDAEYIINVLEFDINKRIPLGFKNPVPAAFKLRVGEILNLDLVEHVYLHDKISENYYEITNNDYEISLPAGVNNTQYELTFVDGLLTNPTFTAENLQVLQNNDLKVFTVLNPGLQSIKSIQLFDIAGKLILNSTSVGATDKYQYPTSSYSDAIYIVKLTTSDNQEYNKKITVYNGQ